MLAARRPLLADADAPRALDVASDILAKGVALLERVPPDLPGSMKGYLGPLLIADALANAGRAPQPAVEELMRRALVLRADELSLHGGAAGLLVVLDAVDPDRASLPAVRARLRGLLADAIRGPKPVDFDDFSTYDLIYGTAGEAIALAGAEPDADALSAFAAWAQRVLDAVEDRRMGGDPRLTAVNLGVAHGVPGILAALNAAFPNRCALARRYVDLLLSCAHSVDGALRWHSRWWPHAIPPATRSWCYRTAGVAAVLYDRALLDEDAELRDVAVRALDGVLHDERDDPESFAASLCHGRAGVAVIAQHVAREGERFVKLARTLAKGILDEYDERRPLGYRSHDIGDGAGENRATFLDGSFGIALFLADAATGRERRWLPLLGLLPTERT